MDFNRMPCLYCGGFQTLFFYFRKLIDKQMKYKRNIRIILREGHHHYPEMRDIVKRSCQPDMKRWSQRLLPRFYNGLFYCIGQNIHMILPAV